RTVARLLEFHFHSGEHVPLQHWDKFNGGLDVKNNTTGTKSVYTTYEGHEIMFHVSTMLPFSKENKQQVFISILAGSSSDLCYPLKKILLGSKRQVL
ncbi:putative GTPase-activating Rap/Ran-GAP domain-like protein 3, partial [Apostichopus japonicus]